MRFSRRNDEHVAGLAEVVVILAKGDAAIQENSVELGVRESLSQ